MDNENETIGAVEDEMVYGVSKFVHTIVDRQINSKIDVLDQNIGNLDEDINGLKTLEEKRQIRIETIENEQTSLLSELRDAKGNLVEVKEQSDLNMELLSTVDNRSRDNKEKLDNLGTDDTRSLENRIDTLESAMTMLKDALENLGNFGF